jgi:hypothetical protein
MSMARRAKGIAAKDLDDDELERELRQLFETRADAFFHGTKQALERHTERMHELEREFTKRKGRMPSSARTRAGARARAGQSPARSPRKPARPARRKRAA